MFSRQSKFLPTEFLGIKPYGCGCLNIEKKTFGNFTGIINYVYYINNTNCYLRDLLAKVVTFLEYPGFKTH